MSRSAALIAAHQAADAVTGLLMHDDEGHFGDLGVVEKLAEANVHAIDLRLAEIESCDDDYREALIDLRNACAKHIEGWPG
ncbi:hypothetical protein ACWPMX_07955 [Tsuneonella sp. HG094]